MAVAQGIGTALLICCALSKDPVLPCVVVDLGGLLLA